MAAKDEDLREAKKWFRLPNYEGVRGFSARQWGQQIARRVFLLEAVEKNRQSVLDHEVPALLESPLSPWDYRTNATPLRDFTVSDLNRLKSLVDQGLLTPADSFDQHIAELQTDSLALSPFGHLVIDLHARDADIRASFEAWLRTARDRLNSKLYGSSSGQGSMIPSAGKLREAAFSAWRTNRLLPYCDLKAWAAWKQTTLTELQLVQLLFPRERAMREKLRPVADNVKKYITLGNANALLVAVSDENDRSV